MGFLSSIGKVISKVVDPVAKVVGAGVDLFGGHKQAELQEDFAKQGIRWRVADAKAAGLHPLYALGAQLPTYSPVATAGASISEAGQSIGRALQSSSPSEKALVAANLEAAKSQSASNFAMASYYNSLAAKTQQEMNATQTFPVEDLDLGLGGQASQRFDPFSMVGDPMTGMVEGKASPSISSRFGSPHVEAGVTPGWKPYQLGNGLKVLLPSAPTMSEAVEALGEVGLKALPLIIAVNKAEYGDEWFGKVAELYGRGVSDMSSQSAKTLKSLLFGN